MFDREFLKNCMRAETPYFTDAIFNNIISIGKIVFMRSKEIILSAGTSDSGLWIVASGFVKAYYFDGKKDSIIGFGGTGTLFTSPTIYFFNKPAFCSFQTLTDCHLIRIEKKDIELLINSSHDFTKWMLSLAMGQLAGLELKLQMLGEGDPTSNYSKLMNEHMTYYKDGVADLTRDKLINVVSSKDLASYLGITQSYLSNIRKAIIEEERNKNKMIKK